MGETRSRRFRIIWWIVGVVAMVICIDILAGVAMRTYHDRAGLKGDYVMIEHVMGGCRDSVLVIGSSVALNGIDTQAVSDSLKIPAYNAGVNGQNMPFFLTLLKALESSDAMPKVIILGIHGSDFYTEGAGRRYNILSPYYGRGNAYLDSILGSRGRFEPLFLKSNLYRYNTAWWRILLYELLSMKPDNPTGFVSKPIPPVFPERTPIPPDLNPMDIRRERLEEISDIIKICSSRRATLIIVFTPLYSYPYDRAIEKVRSIAAEYDDVLVWDDTELLPFSADSTMFYDAVHLNVNGAQAYTDTIITRLHPFVNSK